MDISTLNSHYERLQQLSKNEGTLDGLKSGAANCTGLFATEIAELEAQIEQEKAVIAESEEIIAAWISGIADGMTRTIFRLRFLRGLQWCEGAGHIGKTCTEDCVKSITYRFLNAQRRSAARREKV